MTKRTPIAHLSWKVGFPILLVLALAVDGFATHTLTDFQLAALVPLLYSVIVFSVGAVCYRPHPSVEQLPDDELPMVSVLIPAHNEENVIAHTLSHMLRLDYPRYEIIVIDDHSSDRTGEILRAFPVKVVTRRNLPDRGKPEALNAGLEVAQGDVLCVFDADTEVAPNFLRLAVAPLVQNPEICGVQAQVRMYNRGVNFLTAGQDDEFALYSEITQVGRDRLRGAAALGGNGQLTRRSALKALGGWSPAALTEDLDLTMRLFLAGRGRIAHVSEAIVWQEGVPSFGALIRQRTRWAEGMLRCWGEFGWPMLTSREVPLGLKLDSLYFLGSVFLPSFTVASLLFSAASLVPGVFTHALPGHVGDLISFGLLAATCAWSLVISYKRDRRFDVLPGLRSMIYLLHWVPALTLALRNVFMDAPVVWDKTEHRGQGLISTTMPVVVGTAAEST